MCVVICVWWYVCGVICVWWYVWWYVCGDMCVVICVWWYVCGDVWCLCIQLPCIYLIISWKVLIQYACDLWILLATLLRGMETQCPMWLIVQRALALNPSSSHRHHGWQQRPLLEYRDAGEHYIELSAVTLQSGIFLVVPMCFARIVVCEHNNSWVGTV